MLEAPPIDRRTTPRWLQPVVIVFLVVLVCYFATANFWALRTDTAPRWIVRHPAYTWFGGWKMFTEIDPMASRIDAQIQVAGSDQWQPIDLEALFPTQWESGPRYARTWFRQNPQAMKVLASSTCHRLEAQKPERVRFTVTQWQKKLGRYP